MKKDLSKYKGIFPAFYACYDDDNKISPQRTQDYANYLVSKGVNGLYVCGSSGECIYQSIEERMETLENVVSSVKGKATIIAHIAMPSTKDSIILAKHAKSLGVDAIAAIPPIYFKLPDYSVEKYWMDMINATDIDFLMYNIPSTTNYTLPVELFTKMLQHKNVIGVKNSSSSVLDIQGFKEAGKDNCVVFNGPDEQYIAGRIMGADAGIGGTYGVMPELFVALDRLFNESNLKVAQELQFTICEIIFTAFKCKGNLYSVLKAILKLNDINIGTARLPLEPIHESDKAIVLKCKNLIDKAIQEYVK